MGFGLQVRQIEVHLVNDNYLALRLNRPVLSAGSHADRAAGGASQDGVYRRTDGGPAFAPPLSG